MSLLKEVEKKERIAAKRAAMANARLAKQAVATEAYASLKSEIKPQKPLSPIFITWAINICLLLVLGYIWGSKLATKVYDNNIAQDIAYSVSRFTGEMSHIERQQDSISEFILRAGEAPFLLKGDLHTMWEEPSVDHVKFHWQNDHFARKRGVIVVSTDQDLLQRVDHLVDDGDLGNGTAQLHPKGLWVSLQ